MQRTGATRKNGCSRLPTFSMAIVAMMIAVGGFTKEKAGAFADAWTITVAQAAEKPTGQGVIKGVDKSERKLRIAHEPIAALQWPAMTMAFSIAPNVDIDALASGMKITFTLNKGARGGYVIDEIHRAE